MKMWIVEVETALGRKKKGVQSRTAEGAVDEVRRLQVTTNRLDIAYVPPGDIVDVYERPKNKPLPPGFPASATIFLR